MKKDHLNEKLSVTSQDDQKKNMDENDVMSMTWSNPNNPMEVQFNLGALKIKIII